MVGFHNFLLGHVSWQYKINSQRTENRKLLIM